MGFVLTNNCYKAQTNYQSINYNLKQYLAYQAIDPTNFKSNYNDEKNTQYHRVDFIYNAITYNNIQSEIDMTAYFIFNPSYPGYDLANTFQKCHQLVKNWNDSCGRNNLQNIVIDIGDDEYVNQFNTFLTDNEKSGEPLICKNDKGKYYIADPGVSCP
jgi:hypothetical protein